MRFPDGRPDDIEDYLVTVRTGQWFGWADSKNKVLIFQQIKAYSYIRFYDF